MTFCPFRINRQMKVLHLFNKYEICKQLSHGTIVRKYNSMKNIHYDSGNINWTNILLLAVNIRFHVKTLILNHQVLIVHQTSKI